MEEITEHKINIRLFNQNFIMVIIGQMVSIFGNAILRFALPLYVLDKTGSTTVFGTILAISTIPSILFSPLGGILADRVNRKNMMVILDMITAMIIIIFSLLLINGPIVILIAILMIIFSVIQAFYQPVVQASIPVIAAEENLEKANAVVSLVNALANLIGPLLGGVLYGIYGVIPIMIVSILCFFLAAVMEVFIKMAFIKPATQYDRAIDMIQSDFKESIHFISKEKPIMLKAMIILSGLNLFLTSMIMIGLPAMIKVKLGLSSQLYGYTQGAMAVGMIVGGIFISSMGKKLQEKKAYILLLIASFSLVPIGIAFILSLGIMRTYYIISISAFLMMAIITMFNIKMLSFAQRETPNYLFGKVMAYILALAQCTLPIGEGAYGYIFENGMESIGLIVFVTAFLSILISLYSRNVFKKL
jgi:MFS family permease